jgi:hypothetical protein
MALASAAMGVVTYLMVVMFQLQSDDLSFFAIFPKFVLIAFSSLAVYLWICRLMKLDEADPIVRKINAVVFGKR